ncbi:hypothetical protein SAMN04490202_1998 [Pseudomonas reinekei]|uniref:Uncharacterized protein n=1 Tax=Pseudomonas reinekei TaxID=395598 RepID=A0A1H0MSX3_PSERE|nr:hypothetical protein [Pseudomonas reinekei]KAB0484526.1 hypothetical protein F7R15_16880 [Pseudomonas reinekei]OLU01350.1 hypothetical protein BVK86_18740 [Pseudomonas reinekei]SDO83416.1 hypothetical protein SAMN04490202_1998 [Pseudomonas reinekei]
MSLASDQRGSESAAVLVTTVTAYDEELSYEDREAFDDTILYRKYVRTNSFIAKPSAANGMANTARH